MANNKLPEVSAEERVPPPSVWPNSRYFCSNQDTDQNATVRYNFLENPFMIKTEDLETIGDRLRELRKIHNQLFVSQIELRINLAILTERQEDLMAKSQYLRNLCSFVRSEKL